MPGRNARKSSGKGRAVTIPDLGASLDLPPWFPQNAISEASGTASVNPDAEDAVTKILRSDPWRRLGEGGRRVAEQLVAMVHKEHW
jgi:hypothetical protein